MPVLSVEKKKDLLIYYENHSTQETADRFGVSRETVLDYSHRYDRNDENLEHLMDRRHLNRHRNAASPSEEELAALYDSLRIENCDDRAKNVLEPTFYRVYIKDQRFTGLRSRAALRKLANRIIGACHRTKVNKANNKIDVEHKKFHTPANPGVGQIDKMYVPMKCFSDSLKDPQWCERIRTELKKQAEAKYCETITRLNQDAIRFPSMATTFNWLRCDTTEDYKKYIEELDHMDISQLLDKRFYQYTFVDEKTRWTFRMMFNTQSEWASYRFMAEVIKNAPFKINRIQTDNGSEFTNAYMKNHEGRRTPFEVLLEMQGISYYRIKPGKPWQNGRVECQHRLDHERFYNHVQMCDLEEGQKQLSQYDEESNHWAKRCLGGLSPLDVLNTCEAC
jgi:hypothetical protein